MLGSEETVTDAAGLTVTLTVEVYGAGLGQRALESRTVAASRCGDQVTVAPTPGVAAVEGVQDDQWWMLWRRGDVLVRLTAPAVQAPAVRTHVVSLDQQLGQELAGVCPDAAAPSDAARRNPTQPDYQPSTSTEPVSVPGDVSPPDAALLTRPLPAPDTSSMEAAGRLTAAPSPPALPEPGTVNLPVLDSTGPGCGWSFTGMTGPQDDQVDLTRQAQQLRATATQDLRDAWTAWPETVTTWARVRAAYLELQARRAAARTSSSVVTAEPTPPGAGSPSPAPSPPTTTVVATPPAGPPPTSPPTTRPAPTTTTTTTSPPPPAAAG